MKPIKTWIVIADGARARIMLNEGPGKGIEALDGLIFEGEHAAARDVVADKPGRTFDSVGEGRHAMAYSSDPHDLLKEKFIRHLAEQLEARQADFDRLVLVAPPQALGKLRKALPKAVGDKVSAEVGKDLTHTPNDELASHLDDVVAL